LWLQVTAGIKAMVQKLPPANQATLREIAGMLHEACKPQWADTSKMDSKKFGLYVTCLYAHYFDVCISTIANIALMSYTHWLERCAGA
jgi:hypothetical protein